MQEICWPGVILLTVFCSEFHQVSLLQCAVDKTSCMRSASCRWSLECRKGKYEDANCLPDNTNIDSYRMCDGGRNCYLEVDACDGVPDCMDDADESYCCPEGSFRCDFMLREVCYTRDEICDGYTKCWDDSDEKNCSRCSSSKQTCDQGKRCYSPRETCDGVKDCADKEDERNCPDMDKNDNDDGFSLDLEPVVALPVVFVITLVIIISCCRYVRKQADREAPSPVRQNTQEPAQSSQFQSSHSYVTSSGTAPQDRSALLETGVTNRHSRPIGHHLRPHRNPDRHRSGSRENLQPSAPLLPPDGSTVPGHETHPSHTPLLPPQGTFLPSAPAAPTAGYVQAPYLNPPGNWQGPSAPPSMGPSGNISAAPPPSYESLFPQK